MQASLKLEHFLKSFKHTTMMVLKKPSRSDYTKIKTYQSIALENASSKIMNNITKIINYLIKDVLYIYITQRMILSIIATEMHI